MLYTLCCRFFFFNDTATTEIYTLSLHDALPILSTHPTAPSPRRRRSAAARAPRAGWRAPGRAPRRARAGGARYRDRKSTRLNSSHANISYAVFCLKKKKKTKSKKKITDRLNDAF